MAEKLKIKTMEEKFTIMCVNTSHPSGQLKYFLLEDEEENTVVFDTQLEADTHIESAVWRDGPICYAVITLADLDFKF